MLLNILVNKIRAQIAFFVVSITFFLLLLRGRVNKKQPNLFLGEIDLFFFDVIAL